MAQMLPQILKDIDFSDFNSAFKELTSKGVDPKQALSIIGGLTDVETKKEGLELEKELGRGNLEVSRGRLGIEQQKLGLEGQHLALAKEELARKLAGGDISPTEYFKEEKELRNEYEKSTEGYETIKSAFNNIKELSKQQTGASDMGMVYAYIKLLDPTSTVGPGEKATAERAGGLNENIRGKVNVLLGQGSLSEKQRKDLIRSSKTLYDTKSKAVKSKASETKKLADRYGLNPGNIILNEPEDLEEADVTPKTTDTNEFSGNSFTKEQLMKERERRRTMNLAPDRGL